MQDIDGWPIAAPAGRDTDSARPGAQPDAARGESLGGQDRPLSELTGDYTRYHASGEINSEVVDVAATLDAVTAHFAGKGISADRVDGVTIELPSGWFNLRPSNTEPVLRLNVEAATTGEMIRIRDEVLSLVHGASSSA